MTREEAILWLQVLKHSQINWVGEQAEDEDIIARCEESEQEAFDMAIEALQTDAIPLEHHRKVLYKTVDQDIEIARLKNRIKELENG